MAIDRGPWNALVDDDGSNLVGSIWNKAAIKTVILDPTDAALVATWTYVPYSAANYTASAGTWTVPAAGQLSYHWTVINAKTVVITFLLEHGAIGISAAPVSLFLTIPAPIPKPAFQVRSSFNYYTPSVMGTGYIEVQPSGAFRLLRDVGGSPWPTYPSTFMSFSGQLVYPC